MTTVLPASETTEHPVAVDRISELYNGSVGTSEASEIARERIHWMCSRARGDRVIDIGCSQGIGAILLAREGFSVTGLDSHPDAIAFATEATARETQAVAARLTWIKQDIYDFSANPLLATPQLATPLFDTVILGEVIEHQALPERFLRAARRLLVPGGQLVLTTPFGLPPHKDHKATLLPADVVRMAEAADLEVTEIEVTGGYIQMTARDVASVADGSARAVRSADALLQATALGALAAQKQHYALMAKRGALVEARAKEIAKHTASIRELKNAVEIGAQALREQESELAKTTAAVEQWRIAKAKAQNEASEIRAALEAANASLRIQMAEALSEANVSRMALEAANATLLAQIAEAQREASETQTALEAANSDLHAQIAEAQAALGAVNAQLDGSQRLALDLQERIAQQDAEHLEAAKVFKLAQKRSANMLASFPDELAKRDALVALRETEVASGEAAAARADRRAANSERAQQQALATYERQINALKRSPAFQLGMILLQGFKSFRAFFRVPGQLLALRREFNQRRRLHGNIPVRELGGKDFTLLFAKLKSQGFAAACTMIDTLDLTGTMRASAYTALARELQGKDPADCARAAAFAQEADPQPWRQKWLAFRLFDAGDLIEPAQLLRALPDEIAFSASEESRTAQIEALTNLFEVKPVLPFTRSPLYAAKPRSLLYISATALPYHLSGYSVRTGALLAALKASGVDLTVATRPGYPWDRKDSVLAASSKETKFAGITYHHFRQPAQDMPIDVYIERAATAIAQLARQKQVAVIHAASNHVNALPALIAARQLGIPFHFEMRGLWEMSRASNVDGFEASERYQLGLDLEKFIARNASKVYAISQPLADFLRTDWGVAADNITVLANGIDSALFLEIIAAPPAKFTIGYAGALVPYEGLDMLLRAVAQLRAGGSAISVVLIGDGSARASLEAMVRTLSLESVVEFTGKLSPEMARARIAACSLVCLPRRADRVCELVPPIKLVEAMAMGVPIVVPDLPAFRAEAENDVTARFFRAGDVADLARAIADVQANPAAAQIRATEARRRVLAGRDWGRAAALIEANMIAGTQLQLAGPEDMAGQRAAPQPADAANPSLEALLIDPERLTALFAEQGIAPFLAQVGSRPGSSGKQRARDLMRIGTALGKAGLGKAEADLIEDTLNSDRSSFALLWAYSVNERLGEFEKARTLLAELERHPSVIDSATAQTRLEKLRNGPAYQLEVLNLIEERRARAITPVDNRICYMLHNSLPFSSGGYATRSHGVATGLRDAGFDVIVMTRPGFPQDTVAGLEDQTLPETEEIDGIVYFRTLEPKRRSMKFRHYIPEAAKVLEEQYRKLRPSLVVSASNYIVALPALIACRRLGIPFVYEVRGFWEVTKMSREEDYSDSAHYKMQSQFEAAVCKEADHVFTLTEPMREELIDRGVAADKIDLLANSCDPAKFIPRLRDDALAAQLGIPEGVAVIGYVGTFVDYEGLEDLAMACGLLKQRGHAFRLLLVGNENTSGTETGPITRMIADEAAESGFSDWLIMPGRVPHDVVHSYYSLLDICPFPRKPWPVCEMVSPMKPLEALAMQKLVIVSSVRALVEMIDHNHTGLVFTKGDIASLADTLERAMASPELRKTLGANGRKWVENERTWRTVGLKAARLLAPYATPSQPGVQTTTAASTSAAEQPTVAADGAIAADDAVAADDAPGAQTLVPTVQG